MSAAVSFENGRTHLRVVTHSELREARACMRRHKIKYILRRRARGNAEPLTFGTLTHIGHEAWLLCDGDASARYEAAVAAVRSAAEASRETDNPIGDYMLVTVEELLLGYTARWADVPLRTLAVERSFDVPLVNPETGHASRTFRMGGKFDAIVATPSGHGERLHVFELKTTASDIEAGSLYWERVRALDTQVSIYIQGARASGYAVDDCIYSVIRKPGLKPLKATPEESRKYTKTTKAEPVPRLYASMREFDESPEEYRLRLRADISERPDRYYARATIVRLEADEREHAFDMWQSARMLREAELSGFAPRNPDACGSFGGCEYLGVCTGEASLGDDRLFRTSRDPHEELVTVE